MVQPLLEYSQQLLQNETALLSTDRGTAKI